jgi:hypothetical protein
MAYVTRISAVCETGAQARQIPQVTDWSGRDKAATQHPLLQQLRNPLAILGIPLAPRHGPVAGERCHRGDRAGAPLSAAAASATALLLLAGPAIAVDSIGLAKMRHQTAESGPARVPRRRPGDAHQRQGSARCLRNYDRIRPIMTASSPNSRACRCLRRPGGGCRTRLSHGSRLAALRSDTDSSAPSSCAAGRPSEP